METIILKNGELKIQRLEIIRQMNKLFAGYAKKAAAGAQIKATYLDKDNNICTKTFSDKDLDKVLKMTDDIIYFQIERDNKRIDMFYRNLDCCTGNIHVFPGIVTIYDKSEKSRDLFTDKKETYYPRAIYENGLELCTEKDDVYNDLKKVFLNEIEVPKEGKEQFTALCIDKSEFLFAMLEVNDRTIMERLPVETKTTNQRSGMGIYGEDYAHFYWLYELEELKMTLFYYNCFGSDDKADLYTFFGKFQRYDAYKRGSRALSINKYSEENKEWQFFYPKAYV